MIATLVQVAKELARYEGKKRGWNEEQVILHRLCESAIRGKDLPKVAVIDVTNQTVRLEDYRDNERYKYLYALSTGNTAIGPSWLLDFRKTQGKSPKKTRDEIIKTGIKKIKEALASLQDSTSGNIANALEKKLDETCGNELLVLATVMKDGKMPGEREELRTGFIRKKVLGERRAETKGAGYCAVCGTKGQVSSAIPFRFFTIEKLGFSPMGREGQVWKYAPVCDECAKWLYVAESYLQENLSTRVAGKSAYLVPDLEPGAAEIEGSFVHFLWEWRERTEGQVVPQDEFPIEEKEKKTRSKKAGGADEDSLPNLFEGLVENIDEGFKGKPPFRSASLTFYQPGQKFMFLYTVSDILPTNLQKAKKRLARLRELLREGALGEGGSKVSSQLRADYEFVGRAWKWPRRGQSESQGTLRLTPMHLVEAILTDRQPPEGEFWQDADGLLRAAYRETISSKDQKRTVQMALAERARLIWIIWALIYRSSELKGGSSMSTQPITIPPGITKEFWEKFFEPRMLLDSPAKRAAFLVGVLFGRVEGKQRSERQSKAGEMPIISRLRGLSVSREEIMKKIFPELMLKLRQLDANTQAIRVVQQAAADFASQDGELSDEEARFCFCLGWALSWTTVDAVHKALGVPTGEEAEETLSEEEAE
ncbi:MAG: TM1802 family CRISPR-associated protein [Blastocatellia bacterium]|nr:TM1802 family CRISPR-associated protein [Blastocatellia bacterium]MDW8166898.1 TM1802 family CRISPR-associated protein [Acidobacteriota bacterium]